MKHYKSVEFLSNFRMQSPLNSHKASLLKTFWRRFWPHSWYWLLTSKLIGESISSFTSSDNVFFCTLPCCNNWCDL